MYIAKKLFLIATLSLGLGFQLSASEHQPQDDQKLLNFTNNLRLKARATKALDLASWMEKTYATNPNLSDQLMNIVNTDESVLDKTKALQQLKDTTEQTEAGKGTSYFTNISTMAKAAAAFVIAASVASYFYFMRPWSQSTTQQ